MLIPRSHLTTNSLFNLLAVLFVFLYFIFYCAFINLLVEVFPIIYLQPLYVFVLSFSYIYMYIYNVSYGIGDFPKQKKTPLIIFISIFIFVVKFNS